ncbi:MAG: hypothetical protein ACK5RG_08180 [Cyclobacteriaceae bacterium]|jgi:hypothetical protein|nr:hypothetical protein [Flammeovirgaceae bacterium]
MKLVYILLLQGLILSSCEQGDKKEKAGIYYDSYLEAIKPYTTGTEEILKETKQIIQQRINSTGEIKVTQQDSLKIMGLFNAFKLLADDTKSKLSKLETFDDFDLKSPALDYVDKSSKAISGSYKEIVFPFQDNKTQMSQEKLESLISNFTEEFLQANKNFSDVQRKFLNKFGIRANN